MAIVVQNSPAWVQGASYLGWDNLFLRSGAVVVESAADVGFPGSNATRWPTYGGGWQTSVVADATLTITLPIAESANSYAIYKHNLGTLGLTVKLQYSSDGSAWTDMVGSEKMPGDDKAIFFIGTAISQKYWRLHIAGLAATETLIIGHAFISNSLQMWQAPGSGWTPPNFAKNDDLISSRSDGGEFLGRSLIRKGNKTSFRLVSVNEDWVRTNWEDVMDAVQEHPFYYAWDSSAHPDEVAYCYTESRVEIPKYESSKFFSLGLKFIALIE